MAVVLSCFAVYISPANGFPYDPPHNAASSVNCGGCHGRTLQITGGSPFWTDNKADTAYNAVCLRCHVTDPSAGAGGYRGSSAPVVQSHGSGSTLLKCTLCHNNHEQEQIFPGKYDQGNFFVATGTADSFVYDSGSDTTTITYSTLAATDGSSRWADLSIVAAKTGASRGAMLVPELNSGGRWPIYMIAAIDTDPDSNPVTTEGIITVKGEVPAAGDFGIFYGQLIRSLMEVDGTVNIIEYFDREGPKTFTNASATGICQVCHVSPDVNYWTNDGGGQAHNPGTNCTGCHSHFNGFSHGDGGGDCTTSCHLNSADDHDMTVTDDPSCQVCHFGNVWHEHFDRRNIHCSSCHGGGSAKVSSSVTHGIGGGTVGCTSCHNTDSGEPGGSLPANHHTTEYAMGGECTRCHVVGPGVDGPRQAPCGVCHGEDPGAGHVDGRFAQNYIPGEDGYEALHDNAPELNLAYVKDYRACFSCHLDGGAGFEAGVTPVVTPMHVLPGSATVYLPVDLWNKTDAVTGLSDLPNCQPDAGNRYQCDNYQDMVVDPAGYIASNSTTAAQRTAIWELTSRNAGFGLFDFYLPEFLWKSGRYNQSPLRDPSVEGTVMDWTGSANTNKGSWMVNHFSDNIMYADYDTYTGPAVQHSRITVDAGSGPATVISLDGSGGGGKPSATGDITVTINPASVVAAGAQWRLDGGAWQDSGATLSGITDRANHLLEFKPVKDWAAPSPVNAGPSVLDGAATTYVACPGTPELQISDPGTLSWTNPLQYQDFSITSGGLPAGKDAEWDLSVFDGVGDQVFDHGFSLESTGSTSARLAKDGSTAAGDYTLRLLATGSACFGNSGTRDVPVTVSSSGAADPGKLDGEIGAGIIDNLLRNAAGSGNVVHVLSDMYVVADGDGNVATFRVNSDGYFIDANGLPSATLLNTWSYSPDLWYQIGMTYANLVKVADNASESVVAVVLGRQLRTLKINHTTGAISQHQLVNIYSSTDVVANIAHGSGDVYILSFYRPASMYLRAVRIDSNGNITLLGSDVHLANVPNRGNSDIVRVADNVAGLGGDDLYAVLYGDEGIIVHTFRMSDAGSITPLSLVNHDPDGIMHHFYKHKLLHVTGTDVFAALYQNNRGRLLLNTFSISDTGAVTSPINHMVIESLVNGWGGDAVQVSDNMFAVVNPRTTDPGGRNKTRPVLRTLAIDDQGRISEGLIDAFIDTGPSYDPDYGVSMLKISDTAYLVYGSGSSRSWLRTIGIGKDGDSDGLGTFNDNCPLVSNISQADGDGDGIGDACDACPDDPNNDADADGVCDDTDNCLNLANAGQDDGDTDGVGDLCDICPAGGGDVYPACGDPAAPVLAVSQLDEARLELSWTDVVNESGYLLYRCTGSGCDPMTSEPVEVAVDITTLTDVGLERETLYRYQLRAEGNIPGSWVSLDSNIAEESTLAPAAPGGVNGTPAAGPEVTITWDDNTGGEDYFEVQRCDDTSWSCGSTPDVIFTAPADSTSYTDATVSAASTYTYQVVAFYTKGVTDPSGSIVWTKRSRVVISDYQEDFQTRVVMDPDALGLGSRAVEPAVDLLDSGLDVGNTWNLYGQVDPNAGGPTALDGVNPLVLGGDSVNITEVDKGGGDKGVRLETVSDGVGTGNHHSLVMEMVDPSVIGTGDFDISFDYSIDSLVTSSGYYNTYFRFKIAYPDGDYIYFDRIYHWSYGDYIQLRAVIDGVNETPAKISATGNSSGTIRMVRMDGLFSIYRETTPDNWQLLWSFAQQTTSAVAPDYVAFEQYAYRYDNVTLGVEFDNLDINRLTGRRSFRFYDAVSGQELDHHIESISLDEQTVWFSTPAGRGDAIYLYYGDETAPDASDPAAVFIDYAANAESGSFGTIMQNYGGYTVDAQLTFNDNNSRNISINNTGNGQERTQFRFYRFDDMRMAREDRNAANMAIANTFTDLIYGGLATHTWSVKVNDHPDGFYAYWFYSDGTLLLSNDPDSSPVQPDPDGLSFGQGSVAFWAGVGNPYDFVRVRKYAATEPSVTFDTQEIITTAKDYEVVGGPVTVAVP